MKALSHPLRLRQSGFTLVEVLVATAILSIVVVALSQLLSLTSQTWTKELSQTNCSTKAREVLDGVTADIQRAVFRSDLQNFPPPASRTSPTFTFYTRGAGLNTGNASPVRPVSLVTYQLSTAANLQGDLLRSENTIFWNGSASNLNFQQPLSAVSSAAVPAMAPPNDLICKGIAGFEMIFILADGTTVLAKDYKSPTSSPVIMIGVAVAVIDDQVMTQLQPAASRKFANIQNTLESALSSYLTMTSTVNPTTNITTYTAANYNRSIKELWDAALLPIYQDRTYPTALGSGFQTYERFVPCTPFN